MQSQHSVDVVVIGAGLAGGTTAHALIRRGLRVALLDSAPQIAAKGSGNLWGLLTPYLSTKSSTLKILYSAGYTFTQALLREHTRSTASFHQTGALQLPSTRRLAAAIESSEPILGAPLVHRVSASEASFISGVTINRESLHIPDAGFISPRQFIEGLLGEKPATLTIALGAACCSIERDGGGWRVLCSNGASFAGYSVVVCAAHESSILKLTSWLPLEPIRGQTTCVCSNGSSHALRTVISYGGYITPAVAGMHFVGAHYSHKDDELTPRTADTTEIMSNNSEWLPTLSLRNAETRNPRVCFRTSTIDRLPYIGALPDYTLFQQQATQYRSGTHVASKVACEPIPGIFVNVGHGSRGLLSCPIGGEIIARQIAHEPLADLADVAEVTSPQRLPMRLHKTSNAQGI